MAPESFDVLIVGAGISGIAAGYYVQARCPGKRYAILEGRSSLGGTWDLFRYPGIRSDSDMFTLGYSFRPWRGDRTLADGASIRRYLHETAQEFGIQRHMRFEQRVVRASWSSAEELWTVEVEVGQGRELVRYLCKVLYMCTGYYNYDKGHTPEFPGRDEFQGRIVHPQHWPEDLDYRDLRVVVIGSGATAVTLVPAMAHKAAHVTMLQRSPTYVASLPAEDRVAKFMRKFLPEDWVNHLVRWKNVLVSMAFYQFCRLLPELAKRILSQRLAKSLPRDFDLAHFQPSYKPWDQRFCFVLDADLFQAISEKRATVVTDRVRCFTKTGILLESGASLPADIVVTATGLELLTHGGMEIVVDGRRMEAGSSLVYRGVMIGDVPNFAFCVGYTNASWTLRAELSSIYLCRLLQHMDRHGFGKVLAPVASAGSARKALIDLNSGYVQRAQDHLPKQGGKAPWYLRQNYLYDLFAVKCAPLEDGTLQFTAKNA